ncbi:MAG: hypothetical protein CVT65_18590, partial [Actinobacteria bacterium HGW-Actinobacteria-5]
MTSIGSGFTVHSVPLRYRSPRRYPDPGGILKLRLVVAVGGWSAAGLKSVLVTLSDAPIGVFD